MRRQFFWKEVIGYVTKRVKRNPFSYSLIGGVFGSAFMFSLYRGYAAVFEYRHSYLRQAKACVSLNSELFELVGKPASIRVIHSGTVDYSSGFARSKLEASGEKGVAIIHVNAKLRSELQDDITMNNEHTFSDLWEYPYILKWYIISAFKKFFSILNGRNFYFGSTDAGNEPQTDFVSSAKEWDISNGFVVFYPKGYSNLFNIAYRILHNLGATSDFHGSNIRIFSLWGRLDENPDYYKYIQRNKWTNHQRASKYLPIICSCSGLLLVFIGGFSIFNYLHKPVVAEIIECFAYAHPEILSRLKRPAIQEVIGTKQERFIDVDVALLGVDGNSAQMRLTAARGTKNDLFKVARSDLLYQNKWIKLDVQKLSKSRLMCK